MKNKEIEELLKGMRDVSNTEGCYMNLDRDLVKLLLSYIEQLEKDNDTLIKLVKVDEEKLSKVSNTINKAIEIIDLITPELWNISNAMTYKLKDIKYILKGDSDESR